jgi:hypothetical protein
MLGRTALKVDKFVVAQDQLAEILGRRPSFCKGRDHFKYVSDWLSGTVSQPEPELVKTIYYVADAVSEIKQGREYSV